MAELDHRFVAITPAMREGSGLVRFEKEHPNKYFDVAIAEQHSVTVAAGMACDGLKPVVAIYSTFLQRAYDQLIHDVAIQNLPVLFAIDRAGCVGADGPTHNGVYDLTFMRCLPNIVLMVPSDENECRQMLYTGYQLNQPAAVRYPRGIGPGVKVLKEMTQLPIGKGEVRRKGKNIAILAFGTMVESCERIGEELDATVINMRFVKPIDETLIVNICEKHHLIITVEENVVQGGAGSAVNEVIAAYGIEKIIANHGLPDRLIQHGTRDDMLRDAGLDYKGILNFIMHQISEPGQKKDKLIIRT
jgi:1-deoxy-D-xylulose-5-phosphate synthase